MYFSALCISWKFLKLFGNLSLVFSYTLQNTTKTSSKIVLLEEIDYFVWQISIFLIRTKKPLIYTWSWYVISQSPVDVKKLQKLLLVIIFVAADPCFFCSLVLHVFNFCLITFTVLAGMVEPVAEAKYAQGAIAFKNAVTEISAAHVGALWQKFYHSLILIGVFNCRRQCLVTRILSTSHSDLCF